MNKQSIDPVESTNRPLGTVQHSRRHRTCLSMLLTSAALVSCGGGGGDGDSTQAGLDADCVELLSAPPFEYSDELIELSCSDVTDDDFDDDDDDTFATRESDTSQTTTINDIPGSDFYVHASGSSLISGPVLGGTGDEQNFTARNLPFSVNEEHEDLKVVNLRSAAIYDITWKRPGIIGVLENISDQQHCGVYVFFSQIVASETADSDEVESLSDPETLRLDGTSATFGFTKVDDCVAPGSKYYFHKDFATSSTSDFESVVVNRVTSSADNEPYTSQADDYELIAPTTIANSYQINDEGKAEFNIVNQTSEEVQGLIHSTTVYGLNAEGQPLFAATEESFGSLLPGAEELVTMSRDADDFPGHSTSLRVNTRHQ